MYIYKVLFNIRIMRYIIFVEEMDKENSDVMYVHRIFHVQDMLNITKCMFFTLLAVMF
jgi:hypothetical protein